MPWLINPAQLDKFRKSQKNVVIVDASWHVLKEHDYKEEFNLSRIPGARFLDLAWFNDPATNLPNMLILDEAVIGKLLGQLGLTKDSKIIFYDRSSLHTSCRAAWTLKVAGHPPQQLYVLDGGHDAWTKYGGKVDSGVPRAIVPKTYDVQLERKYVATLAQMKANLIEPSRQVVDVRHAVRYAGGADERPWLRAGHVPGSFSFPYMTMFEPDGRFRPLEKIRKQLTSIGVELNFPTIAMCGSGITASILDFVLDLLGNTDHALYDGSWSEWGNEQLYPGEASIAERPVSTSLDS